MGRPKLYKTPEERVLAARSYRAKYYERLVVFYGQRSSVMMTCTRSHKKEINQKAQEKRALNRANGKYVIVECSTVSMTLMPLVRPPRSTSDLLLGQPRAPSVLSRPQKSTLIDDTDTTEQIEVELQRIIGKSSRKFVNSLCDEYLKNSDYSNIYSSLTALERLEGRLRTIQWTAMQGHEGTATAQKVRMVTWILEDLLLNAMEGNDISDLRHRGLLLYQSVDDVC
ncbi:hypothetical protein EV363DRAFT_1164363 [Boletus edulis]|nr:hypothetical protein EV363DRAFT_1164363 [Boletus edulis]